jgi:hypothetical protein
MRVACGEQPAKPGIDFGGRKGITTMRRIISLAMALALTLAGFGAIAGDGEGAAIGAAVGAGAGAGSVYIQGSQDLALPAGTEVTLHASAPG